MPPLPAGVAEKAIQDALRGELGDLVEHRIEGSADLVAARVRHDAKTAVLAATFHDRDEGRRALGTRRRQMIELFDFRKADVDDGTPAGTTLGEQLGQAMQSLRTEHHIDKRCTRDDGRALSAGRQAL